MLNLKRNYFTDLRNFLNKKRYRIINLLFLSVRSIKNLFRFSCISFKVISYKYNYYFFRKNDSCKRRQKIQSKKHSEK